MVDCKDPEIVCCAYRNILFRLHAPRLLNKALFQFIVKSARLSVNIV